MIEIDELTFRYSKALPEVLKGIRATIPSGSFTAIMGSNGSGKSTFARCLNGLLIPTSGEVRIDGLSTINVTSIRDVRRKLGLVFQDPNLQMTSATVERELAFGLENLCLARDEMQTRVDQYLREFGFEERRDDPASSLSAGERQRLAVASVLILNPTHLILDESTSLLSARSRKELLDLVIALHRQREIALVLITQYPSEALLAERLLVLHVGRIVFDDQPAKVFQHGEELFRMGVSIPIYAQMKLAV